MPPPAANYKRSDVTIERELGVHLLEAHFRDIHVWFSGMVREARVQAATRLATLANHTIEAPSEDSSRGLRMSESEGCRCFVVM